MRFLFIDRIEHFTSGKEAIGIKNISGGEEFFLNHYSRFPVFPEPLIIEAIAQVGGWAISTSSKYRYMAIMVMIDEAKFFKPVHPGDQLRLKIEITEMNEYGAAIRGTAAVKEETVAQVERIYYTLFEVPEEYKKRIKAAYIFASGTFWAESDDE
jgi:3-hydroxyacyl-[acyl-carrier-protein] dehydratase